MIRIAITPAAFEAISQTIPFGDVGYEHDLDAQGERMIWLEARVVSRLAALRGQSENYSDVIPSLAKG